MRAVRGGLCVVIAQAMKDGNKDSGVYGAISALAGCLDLIGHGVALARPEKGHRLGQCLRAQQPACCASHSVLDPLEPTQEPRWYVVRDMNRAVLDSRIIHLYIDGVVAVAR